MNIFNRINQIALQHYNQLSLEQLQFTILILDAQNGKYYPILAILTVKLWWQSRYYTIQKKY